MGISLNTLVGIDIGSTTVKACLLKKNSRSWAVVATAFAPTTVDRPYLDVMVGVREAIAGLEAASGRQLLRDRLPLFGEGPAGCDAIVVASSAGGGCQMIVMGVMKELTAESAQRAALGGGALVLDVIAVDDGRTVAERIQLLRELAPDAIMVSGGTDGGNVSHVVALAELIRAAGLTPRFGENTRIPVIYAGNVDARGGFLEALGDGYDVRFVDNIRPVLEREVIRPVREEIVRVFLEHVVNQAPGYAEIDRWAGGFIRPTPLAVGFVLEKFAFRRNINVLAVDVGGATTDFFSVMQGVFNRTVSAGIGVGYALGWGKGVDFEGISRWVPLDIPPGKLKNWLANKMLNPRAIPVTTEELKIEHGLARYAINTALRDHHKLAVELKGIQTRRSIADVFEQICTGRPRVDLTQVDVLIGTGGLLTRAPNPAQAFAVLVDGIQPEGITEVYLDIGNLMPVAGLIEEIEDGNGVDLLESTLTPLGTVVCPSFSPGRTGVVLRGSIAARDGSQRQLQVNAGSVAIVPLACGETAEAYLRPARGVNLGNGPGRAVKASLEGGLFGVVIDARGRPLDERGHKQCIKRLIEALGAYTLTVDIDPGEWGIRPVRH